MTNTRNECIGRLESFFPPALRVCLDKWAGCVCVCLSGSVFWFVFCHCLQVGKQTNGHDILISVECRCYLLLEIILSCFI